MPVVMRMTGARAVIGALALAALALSACVGSLAVSTTRCGERPPFQSNGAPTPNVATTLPSATIERAVVIGVWSDCIRPETASARPGQLVQWQAIEAGPDREIVLEDGTSVGFIRHVLEFRFTQPGTYRYHLRDSPQVTGTIVVR